MKKGPGSVAAFCLLGVASCASAAPLVSSPAAGETLRAGRFLELRWSGVPAGTEEMELLLSLDDGATFPVRVTEKLDGDRTSVLWRVPNLPAARARLLVRYESDEAEKEGETGPAFRIERDPALPLEVPRRREGELWLDASAPEPPGAGAFEDSSVPTVRDTAREDALLDSSRNDVAVPDEDGRISEVSSPTEPERGAARPRLPNRPGTIPQRK